jgi:hypothetical protein
MIFPYTHYQLPSGKVISRPIVPVTLKYRSTVLPVEALVDTGADETVLPLEFATLFGFSFDLEKDGEQWEGAGGGLFRIFRSPKPIEFILEQNGFPPLKWKGHVCFTLNQPTILLGHRECLEYMNSSFMGKKKLLEMQMAK